MTVRPLPDPPPGFDDLSKEEQIEYVQALWNRIASTEDDVAVPEWHRQILQERRETSADGDLTQWGAIHDRLKKRRDG